MQQRVKEIWFKVLIAADYVYYPLGKQSLLVPKFLIKIKIKLTWMWKMWKNDIIDALMLFLYTNPILVNDGLENFSFYGFELYTSSKSH